MRCKSAAVDDDVVKGEPLFEKTMSQPSFEMAGGQDAGQGECPEI